MQCVLLGNPFTSIRNAGCPEWTWARRRSGEALGDGMENQMSYGLNCLKGFRYGLYKGVIIGVNNEGGY